MAVPRVSVSISLLRPIRPREGIWNSSLTRPDPLFTIFDHLALAGPEFLDDNADELFRAVDYEQFLRLMCFPVDLFGKDLGLADHSS